MRKCVFLLLLTTTLWPAVYAQNLTTADEVLNAYFNALGGKETLLNLKDITSQAASITNGVSFPTVTYYKAPLQVAVRAKTEKGQPLFTLISNGQDMVVTVGTSKVPISRSALDRLLLTLLIIPELHLAERGVKTAFAGREAVAGKDAYKLTHTMPDGSTWSTYYDVQTGLKVKIYAPGLPAFNPDVTLYSDYREVNGIKLPFLLHPGKGTLKVDSYQLNTGLSDAEFTIPQ